ncbi:MAG: transketolase [Frankiaceae bacterium]|jgi:transketolase|nr:transketolase [Frankiaceae bacterium]MDX6275519.1 transketolase [Frankiales bacterium]
MGRLAAVSSAGTRQDPADYKPGEFAAKDIDGQAINVARALAMDAVERANSGHPGTPMALAPLAHLIFQEFLRHDPTTPDWAGRDRFVLSAGHASMLLYAQLYLTGYGLSLDDLKDFRQWASRTPGHPEHGHTVGIETTTGPLGQGFATTVGMAMAARRTRALWCADGSSGDLFDPTFYVICSDGDLEEGIASEAASLAGHQRLGSLVYVYDDNHISIEGDTAVAFSEDVLKRFEAYGWHTQRVDDAEDLPAIRRALTKARDERDQPSIIALRSHIGFPSPHKTDTGAAHGSPLGADEIKLVKTILGLDPDKDFDVPGEVLQHTRKAVERGQAMRKEWEQRYAAWASDHADAAAERERQVARRLPAGWDAKLPTFEAGTQVATRTASGKVLAALAPALPELFGGSADLAGSNDTTIPGEESFLPGTPTGRTIHWGIREHAMGATMNGMALFGGTRPYGGTFLVFSDYMRGSVRLAALMKLPVTYVWTHDSIGLGEDGPTHQPIEHLAALRAIPNLDVVRPADAAETAVAWRTVLERDSNPAGMILTRQKLPVVDRETHGDVEGVARGGYVLADAASGIPQVILMATGSEVSIALAARDLLEADGAPTRVVSLPCLEWFAEQDQSYRDTVLLPAVKARVAVEAASPMGWREWVGDCGEILGIDHFGASAPYEVLYEQFGLTPERVAAAAHASIAKAGLIEGAPTGN